MKSERNTTRQKEIIIKKTEAIREGERQNQRREARAREAEPGGGEPSVPPLLEAGFAR